MQLVETPRLAALIDRVVAKTQGSCQRESPRGRVLVVPGIAGSVVDPAGVQLKAIGKLAERHQKHRRTAQTASHTSRSGVSLCGVTPCAGTAWALTRSPSQHAVPNCHLAIEKPQVTADRGVHTTCSSNSGSSTFAVADELRELEQSGIRITWPSLPRARPAVVSASAKPEVAPTCTVAAHTPLKTAGPEVAPEVAAAIKELEEMQACGLRVRWPG